MNQSPKPFEKYRHFKGNVYQILAIAKDSETGEDMVVYQGLYEPYQIYVRSMTMFLSDVDKNKYPESKQQKRFQLIDTEKTETVMTTEVKCEEKPEDKPQVNDCGTINPSLARFLDANGEEEKLNVLFEIRHEITPEILIPMELSLGMEPQETSVDERILGIKTLLLTKQKYERHRL